MAPAATVKAALADAARWVTRHAVERWCERYDETATQPDAAAVLARVSREAIDTGAETYNGRAIYLHPEWPHARFVVAREPRPRKDALVTILDAVVVQAKLTRRRKPRR